MSKNVSAIETKEKDKSTLECETSKEVKPH